jgi:hypothetical protein
MTNMQNTDLSVFCIFQTGLHIFCYVFCYILHIILHNFCHILHIYVAYAEYRPVSTLHISCHICFHILHIIIIICHARRGAQRRLVPPHHARRDQLWPRAGEGGKEARRVRDEGAGRLAAGAAVAYASMSTCSSIAQDAGVHPKTVKKNEAR